MNARKRFKLIVYSLLLVIALGLIIWYWLYSSAQGRDYERLADLRLAQSRLIDYYLKYNTFKVPYCPTPITLNDCQGKNNENTGLENIVDPLNDGTYYYNLVYLGDDDFQINFTLEVGINGLPAGIYKITKAGVSQ